MEIDAGRLQNALCLIHGGSRVWKYDQDLYLVESQKTVGKFYAVNLRAETCECPDFQYRGLTCKHIAAAWLV